ncbi:metal ABC transporter solute-binding protein, Zn/Mn family [Lichenicoccus sp.]|uniref:metal ABC transporter solute-binding protein, Zn/Mn family n=1 Tax=Lichenicoccus sp. TaxID=2781899 RepID=UPI003D11CDA3
MWRLPSLWLALLVGAACTAPICATHAASPQTHVIAAENVYGNVAAQIGGASVTVRSILSNPDQDPHLFEASPSVARALSHATMTISNGAGYDPWMDRLLAATPKPGRRNIVVARLVGAGPGANPHLWYDPRTMRAFAVAFTAALDAADPAGKAAHDDGRDRFLASLGTIAAKIAAIRARDSGTPVTATEPVFGLMATRLGLVMRNPRFQVAVMNDVAPGASEVAEFERDLRQRRVRLLLYNRQASDSASRRLLAIARDAAIPVVGVSETEPRGMDYQHWMLSTLDAVGDALSATP